MNTNEVGKSEPFTAENLGDGYIAVPYDAVCLNGAYIPTMVNEFKPYDGPFALRMPKEDNSGHETAMGEDGHRPYRYTSWEQIRADKETLVRARAEAKAEREARVNPQVPEDFPDYEDLARWIENAPLTMLPDILFRAVKAATLRQVFRQDGMAKAIYRAEHEANKGLVPAKGFVHTAYFVALFDRETHELAYSTIWSSPPWQQSMLPENTLCTVLFEVNGDSYADARRKMFEHVLRQPHYQAMFGPAIIGNFRDGNSRMDLTAPLPKLE